MYLVVIDELFMRELYIWNLYIKKINGKIRCAKEIFMKLSNEYRTLF
jgi:hypothetical protein